MHTLIAVFSGATEAVLDAVQPERVVLIASAAFRDNAAAFRDLYAHRFRGGIELHVENHDPNAPTPWQTVIERHIGRERDLGHSVTVDVTAGTVPMSLGAYTAAEHTGSPTAYLASTWDDETRRRTPIGLVAVPSVRNILGLDWLLAGDKAFALGQFDTANALYAQAGVVKASCGDVLAKLARSRRAWLDGHYVVARAHWPREVGPEPMPWNLLVGRLAGKRPYEVDDQAFAAWLRDRRYAVRLRYERSHAPQDVAREAWNLVEVVLRATLRRWQNQGAQLLDADGRQGDVGVDSKDKFTLGPLLGLVCDGRAGEWTLRDLHPGQQEPVASPCRAFLGKNKVGLEVRNGLAHGYAQLNQVELWVAEALERNGPFDQLIQACMPPGVTAPEPSPLEDPKELRKRLAG